MPPGSISDLRRRGLTVRSVIDCCIAEIALRHEMTLVHDDRDFATIGRLRALSHVEFRPGGGAGDFTRLGKRRCASGWAFRNPGCTSFPMVQTQSTLTCPACGFQSSGRCQRMPACISTPARSAGWTMKPAPRRMLRLLFLWRWPCPTIQEERGGGGRSAVAVAGRRASSASRAIFPKSSRGFYCQGAALGVFRTFGGG